MKNLILSLWLFSACSLFAQVVTTNPVIVTQESGEIEVIFDAAQGTGGLKGYTGDVYAHTGVITTASTSNTDWKHGTTWEVNEAKYKLSSLGSNKWKLLITPSINEYYGVAQNEKVLKLAFVFRSGDRSKEGKDTGGADIFIDVHDAGLAVSFITPTTSLSVAAGTNVPIDIACTQTAKLTLYVNGSSVSSLPAATRLTYIYSIPAADDYLLVAEAQAGTDIVRDTVRICSPVPVTSASRPAGVVDGINYINSTTVTLVMYAPNKKNIFLIGDFNEWAQLNTYQMKKDGNYWWYTLENLKPGQLYGFQYLVDETLRVSDAYTELVLDPWNDPWINEKSMIFPDLKPYPVGKTSGLVATFQTDKPAYSWNIANFQMPKHENMVVYELLLRDFTAGKSLQGAFDQLDYLSKLGVTAIELMPIQEFDGNNSWGYNPNHYFAPDKAYGTPEMYKRFIDECHRRGIAVILDVAFNHATGNNPFAKLYWNDATNSTTAENPWFNVKAPHPYGVFHDFNHEFSKTRTYFKQVLQYWLKEYKVDGFRLDLSKGFTQNSSTDATAGNYDQSRIDILTDYYNAAKAANPNVMFILEHFCAYDEESALANKGMFLWRKMNDPYSQAVMGWRERSSFEGMNSFPRRWVGYAESHDEERNFYKAKDSGDGNIKTTSVYLKRVPLNIAFVALLPGPKMIWQFGEFGYDITIGEGSQRVEEKPSAFALGWPNNPARKAAYEASCKIISLRKLYPEAFTAGNFALSIDESHWDNGRKIKLTHNDLNMFVAGNFRATNTTTTADFPSTGTWYELLTDQELNVTSTNMQLSLAAGEVRVYTDRKINIPNSISTTASDDALFIYHAGGLVSVVSPDSHNITALSLYSLQGSLLKTAFNTSAINVSDVPGGLYLLEIRIGDKQVVKKVVIR